MRTVRTLVTSNVLHAPTAGPSVAASSAVIGGRHQSSGNSSKGGLSLGLDFSKMDFKEIAHTTNTAIQKDKRVGQFATSTGREGDGKGSNGSSASLGGSPDVEGAQSSSEQEAIRQIDRRIVDSYQYGTPTTRGPLKEPGVIDRLLDFKLVGEWSRAIELLSTSVSNPGNYRRWNSYHFKIMLDILTGEGRVEELWKVWRLAKATNKFVDAGVDGANSMMFRLGRQSMLQAVLHPAPGAQQADQYVLWWVQMCRDLQAIILDGKGEISPKCTNIQRAFEADDPRSVLTENLEALTRITTRKQHQQQGDAGGSPTTAPREERQPRQAYNGHSSQRGGRGGRGGGRGGRSWTLSDPTNERQHVATHHQQQQHHRHGGEGTTTEEGDNAGPPPRDYTIHDPVNVHELNEAIDQAQSVEEVERLMAVAAAGSIEHDCNTFARRMQKICLRRRGYHRVHGVEDPPYIANIWSDAIALFHQGVAVSPNNVPSTLLCNNLMSEMRKARRFEELQQVEAIMRGEGGQSGLVGAYWDIPPSSKTVDYLMSSYYREGYYTRCRDLFVEMKANYAAKLSPLVYTLMIKIKSFELAPRRTESGEFVYPSQIDNGKGQESPDDTVRKYPPREYTARAAARHAHAELSELVHEMVHDGADSRLGEKANIALINAWTASRKRRR